MSRRRARKRRLFRCQVMPSLRMSLKMGDVEGVPSSFRMPTISGVRIMGLRRTPAPAESRHRKLSGTTDNIEGGRKTGWENPRGRPRKARSDLNSLLTGRSTPRHRLRVLIGARGRPRHNSSLCRACPGKRQCRGSHVRLAVWNRQGLDPTCTMANRFGEIASIS